ncbi:MAG: Esterase EstD [Chlamydiae bacterium]|nr:Esterase EstD [Chlamydiota bacterium]
MKKIIFPLLAIASLSAMPQQEISEKESVTVKHSYSINGDGEKMIIGDWSGELDIGPMKLTLVLHAMEDQAGNLIAKIDCLEQNMLGVPVNAISFQNSSLKFEMSSLKADFEGIFKKGQNEISGKFNQAGLSLPLTFRPGTQVAEPLKRPQEPIQPFPYKEEEVAYQNPLAEGVTLSGTLTLPKGSGPFPVVLLIAGSGALNRNEEVCGHKIFLVLADHLTRQGIGVLRVDKRGVGKSTGNYEIATSEDFAKDVIAGIEYLKTRKEVNPDQIGLIGHSEGGLVAPMAATKTKDVAFIVLMAGLGVNGEEILLTQGSLIQKADNVPEEHVLLEHELRSDLFKVIKEESNLKIAEKRLREVYAKHLASLPQSQRKEAGENSYEKIIEETLESSIKRVNTPWFRFFLTFEPSNALQQIKAPLLALNGELDLQVQPAQNLPVISKALEEAGNQDYTIAELPRLNHLFQTCETGALTEYAKIEETISPKALNLISDWILQRTVKKHQIKNQK